MLYEINVIFLILQMPAQKRSHVADSLFFWGKMRTVETIN